MPDKVAKQIRDNGGLWHSLIGAMPEIAGAAYLVRTSTSSAIINQETGELHHGRGGMHIYVMLEDGANVEEFLSTLYQRCWLAGLGWMLVGAGGQLLERSIVDRSVYGPERIVFEGAPTVIPPLRQDDAARLPKVRAGKSLESPPTLCAEEKAQFDRLIHAEITRLAPDCKQAREAFTKRQGARIRARHPYMTVEALERLAERMTQGELGRDVVLPFDDQNLEGRTATFWRTLGRSIAQRWRTP